MSSVRLPSSRGIEPDKLFSSSHRFVSSVRLPSSRGTSPVRLLSLSRRAHTLLASLVSTPSHSDNGASVFQLVLSFQVAPPVASYSATSAALSNSTEPCPSAAKGATSANSASTTVNTAVSLLMRVMSVHLVCVVGFLFSSCGAIVDLNRNSGPGIRAGRESRRRASPDRTPPPLGGHHRDVRNHSPEIRHLQLLPDPAPLFLCGHINGSSFGQSRKADWAPALIGRSTSPKA